MTQTSSRAELLQLFAGIRCFEAKRERAANKPLLLLYALGRLQAGELRLPYAQTHEPVAHLLRQFGTPRQRIHPEAPFSRLAADGLWELAHADDPSFWTASGDLKTGPARAAGVTGGFRKPIAEELRRDASLLRQVAHELLDRAFPPSLHAPILEAVGLDLEGGPRQRPRDPRFAYEVLRAYRRRCAMCGFGLRLGDGLVALDAAHIRWHAAEGPDSLDNGLALCALHHRLFDHGALTVVTVRPDPPFRPPSRSAEMG